MARIQHRLTGGAARSNLVEQGYFLKPMPQNPYIGSVHDGVSEGYRQGFSKKHIHWLYRFRYNLLPHGIGTGLYNRNPGAKYQHWMEVSTIEKFRKQCTSDEAYPMLLVMIFTVTFTLYHLGRLMFYHPDLTVYNVAVWTTKPWVQITRFSKKNAIDQRTFRFMHRAPEIFMTDPLREFYKLEINANDPYYEWVKSKGREKELLIASKDYGFVPGQRGKLLPAKIPYDGDRSHKPGMYQTPQ